MYAIAFDLKMELLEKEYPGANANNAYAEIKRELKKRGFDWMQGSVYFGSDAVNAVTTVTAIQEVARELPWFGKVVRDIRMLRIEEFNDLSVALPEVPEASKPDVINTGMGTCEPCAWSDSADKLVIN